MKLLERLVKMKNKKTLLYLVTSPRFGGAQKYVQELASWLQTNNIYDVSVACGLGKADWLNDLEKKNIPIFHLNHVKRRLSPWHDLLSLKEIYQLLKKIKPDILHLNSSKIGATGSLAAAFYRWRHKHPLQTVYTVHGLVLNERLSWWRWAYYWLAEKLTVRFKNILIAVSDYDRTSLIKKHITSPNKIKVVHNGLTLDKLHFLPKGEAEQIIKNKYNLPSHRYLIGTIANLYANKNISSLIKAAAYFLAEKPDAIFLVIGEGPERKYLEKLILKNNLEEKFFLLGNIKEASTLLPAFSVFALPSRKEGLPYTILEAMAVGLPIAASRRGGIPEILKNIYPESQFRLTEPDDWKKLAKSILNLINKQPLGKQELANIRKKISSKLMFASTLKIYQELEKLD